MAKKALKRKQVDMSTFFARLRRHDPSVKSKLDEHLQKLADRRRAALNIADLKWRVWRSAYMAMWHDHWVHHQKPEYVAEASAFLATLKRLEAEIMSLRADPDRFALVVGAGWKQEDPVRDDTRDLLAALRCTDDRIRNFLNKHFILEESTSNAADHFIRRFAEMAAIAWRAAVAPQLERRRDRQDFVGVLGAALHDFGYPLSEQQAKSDRWLYYRVGHYDIWK